MSPKFVYRSALAAALTLSIALPAPASVALAAPSPDRLSVRGGEAAILTLGSDLPSVAKAYGRSAAELTKQLRVEKHLRVDGNGKLLYVDAIPALPATTPTGTSTEPAIAAAGATFALHSRPGSKRVLYLDFDGHLLTGTAWNAAYHPTDLVCPPWDIDGNPAAFGAEESTRIQQAWARVAEDYAPFDVDVTTEYPGEAAMTRSSSTDDTYGMRVLISPISSSIGPWGGVAYVGVFDYTSDYYKPALVFPENLGNNAKYMAEAISHEAGHTFGLSHDGTTAGVEYYTGHGSGETGWAPIMGSSYSRNLTQWSRGEYTGANNTENDLTIISSGGAPLMADDVADAVAKPLAANSVSGLLDHTGDVDGYSLSAGTGTLSASVSVATLGADADTSLELVDSAGVVIAQANAIDALGASLTAPVTAGTFAVRVRATGKGTPATAYSNFASLGAYTLTVSAPQAPGVAPIAVLNASATGGVAPLPVQFDSTGSADPDGAISSVSWDFGDGTSSLEANPWHTYTAPGIYTARLTVTDSSGLSTVDSAVITVTQPTNTAPIARLTGTGTAGPAPLTSTFDGTGSTDPDGAIVAWNWSFGDGTTASGAQVQHTFAAPGTFSVTLTVTDDRGATSSAATTVVSQAPAPAQVAHVAAITLNTLKISRGTQVRGVVRIVDQSGAPVPGAAVTAKWSGKVTGSQTLTTDASGLATFTSKTFKGTGTTTLTVTNTVKTGWTYDAKANIVTTASIAAGSLSRVRGSIK